MGSNGVFDGRNIEDRSIPLNKLKEPINPGTTNINLGDLNNVDLTGANDLDVLTFVNSSPDPMWKPKPVARKIGDLDDVELTLPTNGDILTLKDGKFVNKANTASNGSNPRTELIISTIDKIDPVNSTTSIGGIAIIGNPLPSGYTVKADLVYIENYTNLEKYRISASLSAESTSSSAYVEETPDAATIANCAVVLLVGAVSENGTAPILYGVYSARTVGGSFPNINPKGAIGIGGRAASLFGDYYYTHSTLYDQGISFFSNIGSTAERPNYNWLLDNERAAQVTKGGGLYNTTVAANGIRDNIGPYIGMGIVEANSDEGFFTIGSGFPMTFYRECIGIRAHISVEILTYNEGMDIDKLRAIYGKVNT